MRRSLFALSLLSVMSCGDGIGPVDHLGSKPFLAGDAVGLEFTASVARNRFSSGDTSSVVFTLRNPTNHPVTLTFGGGCTVITHLRRGGTLVHPQPFGCIAVVSTIRLEPGATHRTTFSFRAEGAITTHGTIAGRHALVPGDYIAWAELFNGEGRSTAVHFSIDGDP